VHSALATVAPFGVYEGSFADRNPAVCLLTDTVVGATDLIVGRFGWADPVTGEVSNAQIAGAPLGVVMPRPGTWALTYCQPAPPGYGPPYRYLRAGKPVTLWVSGDFYLRFVQGAQIGNRVYADPATGLAYGSNVGGGFVETQFTVTTNTRVCGLGIVSPYIITS